MTDSSKSTWEEFSFIGTAVPVGTRYLAFGLNSPTNAVQTYADNASLVLHTNDDATPVPEPATLTMLGLGLAGAGARRWRTRRLA